MDTNIPEAETMKTSTEDDSNSQNICITCSTEGECENIFILTFEDTEFKHIFNTYMGFKLSEDSNLKYICMDCINTIISFHTFKEAAIKSFEELCIKEAERQNCIIKIEELPQNANSNLNSIKFVCLEDASIISNESKSNIASILEADLKPKLEQTENMKEENSDVTSDKPKKSKNLKDTDTWKCPYCPLIFPKESTAEIKKHRYLECRGNKDRLRQPVLKTEEILFCCLCCKFKSSSEDEFRNHSLSHKGGEYFQIPPRKYGCSTCDYVSPRKGDLQRHLLSHQSEDNVQWLQCTECEFSTRYIFSLQRHFRRRHQNEKETLAKIYNCYKCDFHTAYKVSLISHQLQHKEPDKQEMFYCDSCSFKTIYKCNLRVHVNLHRNPEAVNKYVCEICGFVTLYKQRSRLHMLTHESQTEKQRIKDISESKAAAEGCKIYEATG